MALADASQSSDKDSSSNPRCYIVFRTTSFPDGRSSGFYQVPGRGLLNQNQFNGWLAENPSITIERATVLVLGIREFRDQAGALQGCILERRTGSAEGVYFGNPARIEMTGAACQVRGWRVTESGGLKEIRAPAASAADPLPRDTLFAGEVRELRSIYGEGVRVLAARGANALEDFAGFSTIVHLLTQEGRTKACAIGWHGTTTFLIEGEFPSIGERLDPQELSNPDQATWLRYAQRYEERIVLEVRPNGTSDDILVLTADASGEIAWHLIDANGVELWRKEGQTLLVDTAPPVPQATRDTQ